MRVNLNVLQIAVPVAHNAVTGIKVSTQLRKVKSKGMHAF